MHSNRDRSLSLNRLMALHRSGTKLPSLPRSSSTGMFSFRSILCMRMCCGKKRTYLQFFCCRSSIHFCRHFSMMAQLSHLHHFCWYSQFRRHHPHRHPFSMQQPKEWRIYFRRRCWHQWLLNFLSNHFPFSLSYLFLHCVRLNYRIFTFNLNRVLFFLFITDDVVSRRRKCR